MSKCVYFVWFNIYLHFKKVVSMFCVSDVCSTRDLFIYLVIIQPQLTNNFNSVIKININDPAGYRLRMRGLAPV